MFKELKRVFKGYKGVSWQNPVFNILAKMMNVPDTLIRSSKGLSYLPVYSVRIRSNGLNGQFNGTRFQALGIKIAGIVMRLTELKPNETIMEIGCGCGRTAIALAKEYNHASYVGWDIDRPSLEASQKNDLLKKKGYAFHYMDVYNNLYNKNGKSSAATYKFPFADNSVDVIYLISVFTHMLTEDIDNYIKEIARILRPGGRCLLSTFVVDHGNSLKQFPYKVGESYVVQKEIPEKMVGYTLDYYKQRFSSSGMVQKGGINVGKWRHDPAVKPDMDYSQDMLVFVKQ